MRAIPLEGSMGRQTQGRQRVRRVALLTLLLAGAISCRSSAWILWMGTQSMLPQPDPEPKYQVIQAFTTQAKCEEAKQAKLAQARETEKQETETRGPLDLLNAQQIFPPRTRVSGDGVMSVSAFHMSVFSYLCLPETVDPRKPK